jgi:hypothetical protein
MAEVEHQAAEKRKTRPNKSLTYPERQAIKLTNEKWKRFIDHVANSGYRINDALKACNITRETYNTHVLTDQNRRDQVSDAKVTWSRRFWDEDILEEIYMAVANGSTIRDAVTEHASPLIETDPISSFFSLRTADVEVAASLKAARHIAMEAYADETMAIADNAANDVIKSTDKHGNPIEVSNPSAVRRAEVRIRTRQWMMSKIYSDLYGDKPLVEVNNNVQVNHIEQLDGARRRMEIANDRKAKMLQDPSVVAQQ